MEVRKEILLETQVSFFKYKEQGKMMDMSVGRVLRGIKNGAYEAEVREIRRLRSIGDNNSSQRKKGELPVVTFSGTFLKGHKASECMNYNPLLILDIDKLNDCEQINVEEVLANDPYIAAYWKSPSGAGFKGLVHLSYIDDLELSVSEKHVIAFKQFYTYLLSSYNVELDTSGKDISRLCYMSSDPFLCIKEVAESFEVNLNDSFCEVKEHKRKNVKSVSPIVNPASWNDLVGKAKHYDLSWFDSVAFSE